MPAIPKATKDAVMSDHDQPQPQQTPGQHDASEQEELLTGHTYDGIQEYDNPTPAWMSWIFVCTFAFAGVYMLLNLVAAGDLSPPAEYERAKIANLKKKFAEIGELEPTAENILTYMNDPEWLAYGKGVFSNCTTCHGPNAEGKSGPNLTDDAYIHVKSVEDIAKVINEGVVAKGMPAWAGTLHPNDVVMVSAYVASLRGTNVPGEGPVGTVPPPWSAGEGQQPEGDGQADQP